MSHGRTPIRGIREPIPGASIIGNLGTSDGMPYAIHFHDFVRALIPALPSGGAFGQILNNLIVSNISGVANVPQGNTLTALLDAIIGTTQGQLVRRNATTWVGSTSTWPDTITANGVLHEGIGANNVITRASFTFDSSTMQVAANAVAGDMTIKVEHTGTGGGTGAAVFQATGANGGGDAKNVWTLTGLQSWAAGGDQSDSGNWKLSSGTALGTNDAIVVTPAGAVTFPLTPLPAATLAFAAAYG